MIEKKTLSGKLFDAANLIFMCLLSLVFLYPVWYVVMASFSEPIRLIQNSDLILFPLGFSTAGYNVVFNNPNIINGYGNTIFIVGVGTSLCMLMTMLGAYGLSRRNLYFKKAITFMIVFTMYFGGGLIPTFLVVKGVGLYNSTWALIIPCLVSTWNMIVMKTAFQSIPASLEESAMLDGANDFVILFRIIAPVSKATLAVMVLFYAVAHWNAWFPASIYLRDRAKYPLQLVMREILIGNSLSNVNAASTAPNESTLLEDVVRYATIVVSTAPILAVYPFVQKYFVTGIMMGSIKE